MAILTVLVMLLAVALVIPVTRRLLNKGAPIVFGGYARGGNGRMPRLAPHTARDRAIATLPQKLRAVCEHSAIEFFEMGKFLSSARSLPHSCRRSCRVRRCWGSGNRRLGASS